MNNIEAADICQCIRDHLPGEEMDSEEALRMAEAALLRDGLPAFGIIDPDYARIYTQARIVAWQYGYSCCAQGSFTRDLDLLLVPWVDRAAGDVGAVVKRIADVAGLALKGDPTERPHGRQSWTLLLPGFGEVRWVDVSAFSRHHAQASREMQLINELLADEGNTVEIRCPNPDGPPNQRILLMTKWTNWHLRSFTGGTLLAALESAIAERDKAAAVAP